MTDADAAPGSVGVVVVAAGAGSRLGGEVPKAFVTIGGAQLVDHAVSGVRAVRDVGQVVLVAPAGRVAELAGRYAADPLLVVVAGGAERTDSVAAGLAVLDDTCDVVLVHDAARCLTPPEVFERVIGAVRAGDAGVVPGLPVVDTVKSVDADGLVTGTPDRSSLRAIQTPQGFARDVLVAAYASAQVATDDAALVEASGYHVRVVAGDPLAFKITTPADLQHAARLLDSTA